MGLADDPIIAPAPAGRRSFDNDPIVAPAMPAAPSMVAPQEQAAVDALPLPGVQPNPREGLTALQGAARDLQVGAQGVGRGVGDSLGLPGFLGESAADLAATSLEKVGGDAASVIGFMLGVPREKVVNSAPESLRVFPDALRNAADFLFATPEELQNSAGAALRQAGVPIIAEEDMLPAERAAGMISELGMDALLGSGGILRAAASKTGRSALGNLLPKEVAEAVDKGTAGRTFFGDVARGVGTGAGIAGFQNTEAVFGPGNNLDDILRDAFGPAGEGLGTLAAGLAGGVAGGFGARLGANTAREVGERAGLMTPRNPNLNVVDETGRRFTPLEQDAAAAVTQRNAVDPLGARGRILENTQDFVEGGVGRNELPTSGMLSQDQGLGTLERTLRDANEAPFRARDAARGRFASEAVENIAPPGSGRALTDEFERRAAELQASADANVRQAESVAEEAAGQQRAQGGAFRAEVGDKEAAAQEIDKIISKTLEDAQAKKNAKFAAIPNEERSAGFLQQAADDVEATRGKLNAPGETVPGALLNRIRGLAEVDENGKIIGPGKVSTDDLTKLRPELTDAIAQARKNGQFTLADNLAKIKGAISGEFANLDSPEAREALRFFQEEFGPTFARGPGDAATEFRKAFNQSRFERTTTPPSQTARTFIRPASPERAESLKRVLETSGSPEAGQKAARQFILADALSAGIIDANTGAVNRAALGRWRQRWSDQTLSNAAPGLTDELDTLTRRGAEQEAATARLRAEITAAKDAAKLTEQEISKGALGFAIGRDPVATVDKIMSPGGDPQRRMAATVAEIGDNEQALTGLKQSVREWLLRTKTNASKEIDGRRVVSFDKLERVFDRHAPALGEVFSPEEMNSLRQVHKLLQSEQIVTSTRAIAGSTTSPRQEQTKQLKRALEAGLKLKFGVLKGGGLFRAFNIAGESLPGSTFESRVESLMTQMMLDPELAAHLLVRDIKSPPAWNKRLQTLILGGEALDTEPDNQ